MSGTVGNNAGRGSGSVSDSLDATKLTGALPAISGANLTGITTDTAALEYNQALLAFKIASSNQLAKFQMVDQVIDEYQDATGIDASASTNELAGGATTAKYYEGATTITPSITHDADDTGTDGDYSWYKWTDTAATGSYQTDTTQDVDYLVIAGGGGGGRGNTNDDYSGGGGGAGGYRNSFSTEASGGGGSSEAGLTLVGSTTYTITVGAGGAAAASSNATGSVGADSSITGSDITDVTSAGGGYGSAGYSGTTDGGDGGSGGGCKSTSETPGSGTTNQGFDGGSGQGNGSPMNSGGGGGGAGAVGGDGADSVTGGDGGAGLASSITGSSVTRAGGGGGGGATNQASAGGSGGGGAGGWGNSPGSAVSGVAGTANTGSGGGAGGHSSSLAGAGGSGVVIIRSQTSTPGANLTLQSVATTAESAPTTADLVVLIEDGAGTATVNTDIKGYVSRDGSAFSSEVTFVDEGDWGTSKRILVARNIDISGITSGVAMKYKLTTHNQSESSKETRIHATSLAWA